MTGVEVLVLIGGVVVAVGIGFVISRIWDWWTSIRQIAAGPTEVYVEVGSQGSVLLFLYRKPARSWNFLPITGPRAVALLVGGSAFKLVTANPVMTDNGLAIVTVEGILPGNGTLTVQAASAQPNRMYGPLTVPVHVLTPGRLPKGATLTPLIEAVVSGSSGNP